MSSFLDSLDQFASGYDTPAMSVVGMAQVGKTTALLNLKERYLSENRNIVTVYLTLASFSSAEEFQAGLYNEVLRETKKADIPIRGEYLSHENTINIGLKIRELMEVGSREGSVRYLVIVDDFDEIRHLEHQRRVTQLLRELIQRSRETSGHFIIVSRRELVDIELEIGGSSLFGICTYQRFLKPGDEKLAVAQGTDEASLRYWAGGHQHIARVVLESSVADTFIPAVHDIYERILGAALENVLDENGNLVDRNLDYRRYKLRRLGLLKDEGGKVVFFANGMQDYLKIWLKARGVANASAVSEIFDLHEAL